MPVYCFRCTNCDVRWCGDFAGQHCESGGPVVRDYRAEAVGLSGIVELRRVREVGGSSAVRDLFLPTAEEYKSPEDPDGSKGIRQWNDEHDPKAGNKRPLRPVVPRKVF